MLEVEGKRLIVQSRLLDDISARQAVVRDSGRPETTAWLPKDVTVIALEQDDITRYLHSRVCQARAPQFPGWSTAEAEWNAAKRPDKNLKSWCARRYGLRFDTVAVRELATATRRQCGIPQELQQVLQQLKTLASAS